jgi:hypothetical protein
MGHLLFLRVVGLMSCLSVEAVLVVVAQIQLLMVAVVVQEG